MANGWKQTFARGENSIDPHFVYVLPDAETAPKLTQPKGITGKSTALPSDANIVDAAINAVYR